jgi:hypothetical protein
MLSKKSILTFLLISLLSTGCTKEKEPERFSCEALVDGLISGNAEEVKKQVNFVCSALAPVPAVSDTAGLTKQLDRMVNLINKDCNVNATVLCYGCIKTLPLQSEVRLSFTDNGQIKQKTIDISSPENHVLSYAGMHD